MKKLLFGSLIAAVALTYFSFVVKSNAQYTGAPAPVTTTVTLAANTAVIVITNNVEVVNVLVTAASGTGLVKFFDASTLADPVFGTNYVAFAYVARVPTNTTLITTNIGYQGYTNYYTNVGIAYLSVTNAQTTNALPTVGVVPIQAGVVVQSQSPMLFSSGVSVIANAACTVTISYIYNR